jgi:multidrug efflux pump subunit AcrA (membrane-fusion protein)
LGQALQVPIAALHDSGKGAGVWVIAGEPAKVSWRPVQLLGLSDDTAQVSGELNVGERIVALGAHLLRDGEEVRLAQPGDVQVAENRP